MRKSQFGEDTTCSFPLGTTTHRAVAVLRERVSKHGRSRRATEVARALRSSALQKIEGDQAYEVRQEFLAIAAHIAKEGRLPRLVYVAQKLH